MRIGNYEFDPELARDIGESAGKALIVLIVAWIAAKAVKWAFAKLVDKVPLLQRGTSNGESIGLSLGKVASLLIWLFALVVLLDIFGLKGVTSPLNELLNAVMGFIPNLIGAALIFFIGHTIARIVKDLVVTALQTVDFDKWANKGGVETVTGNTAITSTIGSVVYVLIIIPVAIGAIDALGIEAISGPATDMLDMILGAIPNILVAALLLGIGYVTAGFAGNFLKDILAGLGVDRSVSSIEILPEGTTASDVIARVVQIAIMLYAAIGAMRALGFPELTAILDAVLALGGKVVFGGVVIGVGFLIANLLAKLVGGSMAGSVVKWATVVLFVFMGLEFMGVGEDIVRLAFGALAAGGAVAGALAFGLGGREWASRQLDKIGK
ncbi:MAG: mechanosensitive ion channel [Novosphingobium sp.]|nr:mechanosensitive ion channel [Novosphingobium sp.]